MNHDCNDCLHANAEWHSASIGMADLFTKLYISIARKRIEAQLSNTSKGTPTCMKQTTLESL